jgi:phage terminase small subunit
MNLTPKQEKFIQNIIQGMSQREAYKDAYKAKYKDEVIDVRACELFNSSKVQVRYKELINQLEDKSIMSAKERMKWLTDVINGDILEDVPVMTDIKEDKVNTIKCPTKIDTKLKALDTLNKMSGEYKTILDGTIEVKKKLEDLL